MAAAPSITTFHSPKLLPVKSQTHHPCRLPLSSALSSHHFPCFLPSSISISILPSHVSPLFPLRSTSKRAPLSRVLAVVDAQAIGTATAPPEEEPSPGENDGAGLSLRPCEIYVCNLPRSCDIAELHEIFKPFGTVNSVEISRDSETGLSRGCGYVKMSSIPEAKAAIEALDGSDLGGREVRVRYSADIFSIKKNVDTLNASPSNIVFESPYKAYVGNVAWSVKPADLRAHFSQFGTLVSARLLYDRRGGRNRVYGFISFSSAEELKAALSSNGKEFLGRALLVREVTKKE